MVPVCWQPWNVKQAQVLKCQVSRLIFTLARARALFVIYHFRETLWHYLNQHTCITRVFSYAIACKLSMIWYACVLYWIKIYFICSKFWWYDFKGAVQVVNLEIFNLFFSIFPSLNPCLSCFDVYLHIKWYKFYVKKHIYRGGVGCIYAAVICEHERIKKISMGKVSNDLFNSKGFIWVYPIICIHYHFLSCSLEENVSIGKL